MTPTIAAILGRFNGDREKAVEYCLRVFSETLNDTLAKEYYKLAMDFGHPLLTQPLKMTHEGRIETSWT